MTYAAPDKVPYDEWFDKRYKYIPNKHPYDSWPIARDTLHEKMYQLSIATRDKMMGSEAYIAVSYTHLTLPTKA